VHPISPAIMQRFAVLSSGLDSNHHQGGSFQLKDLVAYALGHWNRDVMTDWRKIGE